MLERQNAIYSIGKTAQVVREMERFKIGILVSVSAIGQDLEEERPMDGGKNLIFWRQ